MSSSSTHPQPVSEDCIVSQTDADPKSGESYQSEAPQNQNDLVSDIQVKSQQGSSLSRQMTINELPDEMLLSIFSYMNFTELIHVVQNVCTRWRKLAHDRHLWNDIVYKVGNQETDEDAINTLKMAPNLRAVIMIRTATELFFSKLSENCRELTKLEISTTQDLSFSGAKNFFERCNKLEVLKIPELFFYDRRFQEVLGNLKGLRALVVKESQCNDIQLELRKLADQLPHLCEIHLRDVYFDFDDLECFMKAKKHTLKRMTLNWTTDTGKCILPLLTHCAGSLEYLNLYFMKVHVSPHREGFVAMCQLNNLKELTMDSWGGPVKNTFSIPLGSGGLSRLQRLHLRGNSFGDEAILALCQGCPELRELNLDSCFLTDDGCVLFHLLKRLKILSLRCKMLCGEAIARIAILPTLERLHLNHMKLERLEPGLRYIAHMSNLRSLHLNWCSAQNMPFEKFPGKLINLRELHLYRCQGRVSKFQVMCKRMPELKVYGELHELVILPDTDDEYEDEYLISGNDDIYA